MSQEVFLKLPALGQLPVGSGIDLALCHHPQPLYDLHQVEINGAFRRRRHHSLISAIAGGIDAYAKVEQRQSFRMMWQLMEDDPRSMEARVMALHYRGEEIDAGLHHRDAGLSNPSGAKVTLSTPAGRR